MPTPSVGRDVHYVSYGSVGGKFPKRCRAAKVTEVEQDSADLIGLCAINPTGFFFHALSDGGSYLDEGRETTEDTGLCHGRDYEGGSWHWPERVGEG